MHVSVERPESPAPAGGLLTGAALRHLRAMARAAEPHARALQREFARELWREGRDPRRRRALAAIAPAAAALLLAGRRSPGRFLEQVEYNGRRLAKLNVPPSEVVEALSRAGRLLESALAGRFQPAREQLRLATVLTLNNAFYAVREAETQAFFGLALAEAEAADLPDLLRLFARALARAFRARAASLSLPPAGTAPKRAEARYYSDARLLHDSRLRRRGWSGWSFPIPGESGAAGRIELAFAGSYPWLPREAELLRAAAERCGRALERARLLDEVVRLAAAARRAEEEERHRLGRELHDETAQSLLALRLELELLERQAPAVVSGRLADLRRSVERNIEDLRRVIAALSPDTLDRLGLEAALRQMAARFGKQGCAEVRARISPACGQADPRVAEAVYRVAHESLRNISRHARAHTVNLTLRLADESIRLSVVDDGAGFNACQPSGKPLSFGLAGMRERARCVGGTLDIRSSPGKGTAVTLTVPLQRRETE